MAENIELLHDAIDSNDAMKIEQLLSEGTDANHESSRYDESPLDRAIFKRHQESAIVLLKHGAQLTDQSIDDLSVLHHAADNGCDNVIEWLIREKGFDANYISNGIPALHLSDTLEVAQVLLAHGAKINAKNQFGRTALHQNWIFDQEDIVRLLIQNGIDVNSPDNEGLTALHTAVQEMRVNLESVEILLANGANTNAKTNTGKSPLHCLNRTIFWWSFSPEEKGPMMREILIHGAEIDAQDSEKGWTPLHYAVGHPDVVRMYLEEGADINIKSNEGYSPLELAGRYMKESREILLDRENLPKKVLMKTFKYLLQHVIELKVAGLYVSGENLRLVESILSRPDRSNQRSYEQRCKLELAMFKTHTGLGLNCLLTTRYPTYVSNKDLCDRIERLVDGVNYPIYGERVLKKFKHDKGRFRFMELYKNLMIQSKLKPTLPGEIWVEILSHLTDGELRQVLIRENSPPNFHNSNLKQMRYNSIHKE